MMNKIFKKIIYFHVGTSKTGTTFLQHRIFPKFKDIYYVHSTRYRKVEKIINGSNYEKYLVSREFDQQLEYEVKLFSSEFKEAIPIIIFRKHDQYIASQYRRFVKNGFKGTFFDFFDLENDKGYFKKQDLDYLRHIQILEENFMQKPIVLFYEDLKNDSITFIEKLTKLLDVSINYQNINLKKKHTSYSEKQLKAILLIGKYINMRKRRIFNNNILHFLWRLYLGSIRYSILYFAKLTPKSFFKKESLIPENELEKVREFYVDNWKKCLAYSENQFALNKYSTISQ